MENKNLVLTSIKQNFSNETENLLLGNWCQDFSEDNNKKNSIADNHWSLNEKRIKDANYLKKLNEKVLDFFFENLNNIHKKDNTKRYWRILIGPFLYDLIPIIFDRWETVRYFFEKQSIKEIKVKTFKEKNFKSNFYSINSIQSLWFNDEINQKIFNKILEENYGELIKFDFFELREKTKQFTEKKSWKESYYEFLSNILLKLNFYKFLFKFNFCIFDSRIMSNFKFFKLNLKLKNIPLTNFFFFSILEKNFKKENNLNKKLIQNDLRPLLKKKVSRFTRDKFETFLLNILIDLFPEVYLERYNQSLELISSYVIKKPKVIFSKYLIFYNDIYKLWVAEMVERKSILIVSDHGGFVPLFEHTLLKHESKISDYHFIPHDFILASNNLKLPTILNIYKKKFSNLKSSNNLTFIHRECGLYNHKLCSNIPVPNIFIEFKNFTRSIEFLEKKIKDKVRYKCINNTKAYLRQSFSKKYGDKKIVSVFV